MNWFETIVGSEVRETLLRSVHGVVIGIVTNNQDPDKLGRVKVKFPWLSQEDESNWARIASPMAGGDRGTFFLPEVDDEVLVAFEQGDLRFPYILGALWNGKDTPPATNEDGKNNIRMIKSRSGHTIRLNDEDGKEMIEIIDKKGENKITIDTSKDSITITTAKDITLSAPQGSIKLDAQKIELKSSADTKIETGAGMDIKANATMNIKGATINLN
ncbi:phage tail protein [Leptothermofonsia sichuanensis E412]|uniref:phage baseplate assembly protein V n=1 Tax=Leptothermofonsia sichuanensis TaxID=2917832 RepID=UPI001CA6A39A|nr:phage baseplate assembly protein V [Leptothermofonsia sichuanensis]QZZ22021.1 phage tail protein [Leptothermofonsia sichuanensis E412]